MPEELWLTPEELREIEEWSDAYRREVRAEKEALRKANAAPAQSEQFSDPPAGETATPAAEGTEETTADRRPEIAPQPPVERPRRRRPKNST
ncbi:MAG TPA: hypothetical protein VHC22_32465 [Pirellulales bacterium]|nr:hypothetical protein [Pirellulales bacterium]